MSAYRQSGELIGFVGEHRNERFQVAITGSDCPAG